MNLSTACLDASQVESLLHGNLTLEESEAAQNHVEQCEACRARVESTIGPQEWWSEVQGVLLNSRSRSFSPCHDFSTGLEPDESSSSKLLDLLGPTDDPNMLGRIGPYEIIGLLGQGGMGAVFKGFDRSLNRFVAIKMLLPHLAASGAARKRFAREGQAVAAVVDDHVMAIHCVDEWQGVPYLVMTYSRGVSLQKRLSDNGPLEVREILRIGMQTAKGLAAAHAQGIVHRDIKPANIFLDQTVERVQLMDFGLARAVDDASLTRTGVLAGTPQYMSPEQARAETVDHCSDLFSLGSVMYAMCTGHAPFRAESSYSVLRLITDKEPRPIREINPDIPEWLCAIISKLMAKQASDRYSSAKEISDLLEDCLAHVQQPAAKPLPVAVAALAPTKTRRPPIGNFIAAAAFAFALLVAGVFIVLELNKGTLTIQSDTDDVRIRITHGDEVVDELKVSKSGQSVRVAAGNYKVEIVGEADDLVVENGQVTLHRAGVEVVKIVHNASQIQGTWNLVKMHQIGHEATHEEEEFCRSGGYKIIFTQNEMIHSLDHSPMRYRVDTTQTPNVIELSESGAIVRRASFELNGDVLRIWPFKTTDGSAAAPPPSSDTFRAFLNLPRLLILQRSKPITLQAKDSKPSSDETSNVGQIKSYPVQEDPPGQVDLSTPQATLEYIDRFLILHPIDVPVECYTDEAILELSGVILQQLRYQSTLSQLYSHVDAQIRMQMKDVSDAKDSGQIIPGAIPSYHLQFETLLKEHSHARPPEECMQAFESICKWTVASLDGNQSRMIPDRQLYRLAAGILKSPKEFLPKAGKLCQFFRDSSRLESLRSTEAIAKTQYDIVINGDEAIATAISENGKSTTPMKFKLRRVNQRWLVSEAFSDEILTQINLSMPQMTGDTSAIRIEGGELRDAATAKPLVNVKLVSFETKHLPVAAGKGIPMQELIATIRNDSDRPVRSVFARMSYSHSNGGKSTQYNVPIYTALDSEPGIAPGETGVCPPNRGWSFATADGLHDWKIDIVEVSEKNALHSSLPQPKTLWTFLD